MHQTTTITAVPMPPPTTVIAAPPPGQRNVKAILGLGITQIVFGVLTIIFGIASTAAISSYWVNSSGSGIWFGIWILVTGIIGVCSSRQQANRGLNGCNMGFNIVCTVISFFVGIFFAVALAYFNNCDNYRYRYNYNYYYGDSSYYYLNDECKNKSVGIAIYALLMTLMIAEFIVSIVISVYCCQGNGCCGTQSSGVIIQQQQGGFVATSTGHVITSNAAPYPPTSYPVASYPQTTVAYPPGSMAGYPQASVPYSSGPMYVQQGVPPPQQGYTTQAPMGGATMPTYASADQKVAPPPAYNEN